MKDVFSFISNPSYNLRSDDSLARHNTCTTDYGIESITTLGAKFGTFYPIKLRILLL